MQYQLAQYGIYSDVVLGTYTLYCIAQLLLYRISDMSACRLDSQRSCKTAQCCMPCTGIGRAVTCSLPHSTVLFERID